MSCAISRGIQTTGKELWDGTVALGEETVTFVSGGNTEAHSTVIPIIFLIYVTMGQLVQHYTEKKITKKFLPVVTAGLYGQ